MKWFRRELIYVQVHQDHFVARVVGGERTIRRQCHSLANRNGQVKDLSNVRPHLAALFAELKPRFYFLKPWALLHFDPKEYPLTKEELGAFKQLAERSGVGFCFLSTWEDPHQDKDLITIFN